MIRRRLSLGLAAVLPLLLAAAPALQHLHELDDERRAAAYQAADPSANRVRLEE